MNINPTTAAAWLCALLALSTMAELTSARSVPASDVGEFLIEADSEGVIDNFHFSRGRRQAVVPSWRCTGAFSSDGNSYNVRCTTNLDVISVACTLDGENYACGGLEFSVNTSDYVGGVQHVLFIDVRARYGSSTGRLRYTFQFRKQLTSQTVTCRSRFDGENVVVTCSGAVITRIEYEVNSNGYRNANSVSSFTVLGSELRVGSNSIGLRITVSGVTRTLTLTIQKTRVVVFTPRSSVSYDSSGNVVFSFSVGAGSDAIQTIRYTINGGIQRTASSVSRFSIDVSDLRAGENVIAVTFTSVSGTSRTTTITITRSQARVFRVRCQASYNNKNNVDIACTTQGGDSEDIASIHYRVNGGSLRTATSVSRFEVDESLLTQEVNIIIVILVSTSGLSKNLTLSLVQPLSLRCRSETTSTGVTVTCVTNRQTSTVTVQCYLDDTRQSNCALNSVLNFNQLSGGRHTYTVIITDSNDLTVRNQLYFENKLTVTCRGSLNLGSKKYVVQCDSDRDLRYTCTIDGTPFECPDSLQIDISTLQSGSYTLVITGTDSFGNNATSTSQFSIPQTVGSCNIGSDNIDDVVNWRCTAYVAGVSIVCLVDNIRLEDCLCQLESKIYTERYSEGNHTVSLILTGQDGSSKRFDQVFTVQTLMTAVSRAIEPLEFDCVSQLNHEGVIINCYSNKRVDVTCYLDNVTQNSCQLTNNEVRFANISRGLHSYTVVARDDDGLVDRSEIHFEEDLDISCRGLYNPARDVVHLSCDSTRPLAMTQCQLDNGTVIDCPTPYDVPVSDFVNGLYELRVSAQDNVGNTDSEQLTFSTSSCEDC